MTCVCIYKKACEPIPFALRAHPGSPSAVRMREDAAGGVCATGVPENP